MTLSPHEKLIERLRTEAVFWLSAQGASEVSMEFQHGEGAFLIEAANALSELLALRPAVGEARDDALLPNKVLLDNQARAYKADGASGTMKMDTSVAIAMIGEILRSRASPTTVETAPVADGTASGVTSEPDQPTCEDCDGEALVWFAPNDLWNLVKGGPSATDDPGGILCPNCFIKRAEAQGLRPTAWRLEQEHIAAFEPTDDEIEADVNETSAEIGDSGFAIADTAWSVLRLAARVTAHRLLSRTAASPIQGMEPGDEWQPVETARAGEPVIVAVRKRSDVSGWIVGEAYLVEDAADDSGWWWAQTDYGDSERILPEFWQPLPAAPLQGGKP